MKYFDKNGKEIKAGDIIVIGDGKPEVVYETQSRDFPPSPGLGVNASNLEWVKRAQDAGLDVDQEFYPLSQFSPADISHVPECFVSNGEEPYPKCTGTSFKSCGGCGYYEGRD